MWVLDRGENSNWGEQRFLGAGKDGSPRAPLSFAPEQVALFVLDTDAIRYVLHGPPADLGALTGWWTRPLDSSAPPSLIAAAPVAKGTYVATIDRACHTLYSNLGYDIVRGPLP